MNRQLRHQNTLYIFYSIHSASVASPRGGMEGSGPPHFCSDPSWDQRKSVEKFFLHVGGGGTPCMYIVTFTAHQQRNMVRTPPLFWGWRRHCSLHPSCDVVIVYALYAERRERGKKERERYPTRFSSFVCCSWRPDAVKWEESLRQLTTDAAKLTSACSI